jgi:hypothetical protein
MKKRGRPRIPGKVAYVRLPTKVWKDVDREIRRTRRPISTEIEILVEEALKMRRRRKQI